MLSRRTKSTIGMSSRRLKQACGGSAVDGMRIFQLDHRLFTYMEVADDFDPATYIGRYLEEPKAVEWGTLMASLMEAARRGEMRERWVKIEPIYKLR